MCELNNTINSKSVVGYKLVLKHKKTGKYFSSAMGFEYLENRDIPKVGVQKRIGNFWANFILDEFGLLFKKDMVERTACFRYLKDIKTWIDEYDYSAFIEIEDFMFVLARVRISKDLMAGTYNNGDYPVYGGKRIDFLKILKVFR